MGKTTTNPTAPFDCPLGHKKSMNYVVKDTNNNQSITKFDVRGTPMIKASCVECGLMLDFIDMDSVLNKEMYE